MDLYKTLGVKKDATVDIIKKAYRNLSKLHHPDMNGGKESEKFINLNLAYRVLSDPQKRRLYDDQGIVMDESPDHVVSLVRTRVIGIFNVWLDNLLQGRPVALADFVTDSLDTVVDKIDKSNKEGKKRIKELGIIRKRLSCKSGDNLAYSVIDQRVDTYKKGLSQNDKEKVIIDSIREKLDLYDEDILVEDFNEIVLNSTTTGSAYFTVRPF